jgi:hypothetical protein
VLLLVGRAPAASATVLRPLEPAHLADVAVRAKQDGWTIHMGKASYKDMAILSAHRPVQVRSRNGRIVKP